MRAAPPDERHGDALLRLARAALESELAASPAFVRLHARLASSALGPWLGEPGATFVTLRARGLLRGCIGSLRASRPLAEDLRANAVAAATRDPRFEPVTAGELVDLSLEVSLLGPLSRLEVSSELEAVDALRPHVDGVVLQHGERRATFLPQVWGQLPTPRDFLVQLRRKAGLPDDFWHPELELSRYLVTKWVEGEK